MTVAHSPNACRSNPTKTRDLAFSQVDSLYQFSAWAMPESGKGYPSRLPHMSVCDSKVVAA